MCAGGFLIGVALFLGGCALLVPTFDRVVCESYDYDSSYGEGRFQPFPPSVSCDFSRDLYFPKVEPEHRYTGLLTVSSIIAGAAGCFLAHRANAAVRSSNGGAVADPIPLD